MKKTVERFKNTSKTKKIVASIAGIFLVVALFSGHKTTTLNAINRSNTNKQSPAATLQATAQPSPIADTVTTQTVDETETIPFTSTTVEDNSMTKGTTKIVTAGVNGSQTTAYKLTLTNGQQTNKTAVSTIVTLQPVTQVTHIGTYVKPTPVAAPTRTAASCDPNYTGACVPNVYPDDVDCAGGSGNGPYYVHGPVKVIGTDHYGLDRDGDGVACE